MLVILYTAIINARDTVVAAELALGEVNALAFALGLSMALNLQENLLQLVNLVLTQENFQKVSVLQVFIVQI